MKRATGLLSLMLTATALLTGGCGDNQAAEAAKTAAAAAKLDLKIAQATPEEAVRTLFELVRVDLAAAARQDRPAQKVISGTLERLASREDIHRRVRNIARLSGKPADEFFDKVIGRWSAVLAPYYEKADLAAMRVLSTRDDGGYVRIRIASADPQGRPAGLMVECSNDRGAWKIAGVYFDSPGAASQPASSSAP
ncbi:hypothetical protein RAS1_28300 [Phycisphaerae bacterium RAS1]|nr:hypothetical protein RAS1_28300 [Phycisphaerae bacterium RAS1]